MRESTRIMEILKLNCKECIHAPICEHWHKLKDLLFDVRHFTMLGAIEFPMWIRKYASFCKHYQSLQGKANNGE